MRSSCAVRCRDPRTRDSPVRVLLGGNREVGREPLGRRRPGRAARGRGLTTGPGGADSAVAKANLGREGAEEGTMRGTGRWHDAVDAAKSRVVAEGGREGRPEPGRFERGEAGLPAQTQNTHGATLAVEPRLDATHQSVAEEDRQHVVAPATLGGGVD